MVRRRFVRLALVAASIASAPAFIGARASQRDTIPALALGDVPRPVRAAIVRAYNEARARPRDPVAVERLAMLLHAHDQYRSAEACYRLERRLAPRSFAPAYLLALVQADLGDLTSAISSMREALAIEPEYVPARMRLAELLMNAGDLEASRGQYDALVREFPDLALAHYGLGRLADARGDAAAAAAHYERALAGAPQFGTAHYALALAYRDAGDVDRARPHLEAYSRLGSRRPTLPDRWLNQVRALRSTARDLIVEGSQLERAGRIEEAIARHLQALQADPAAAQAHVNLIALYGRTGAMAKAEANYRAALASGSSLAEAHYNYGVLLAGAHRYAEAADAFSKTLAIDPFHAPAHNNLAGLFVEQGRLEEAAVHYREALANDPQHRAARFNLGRVLVALGRPREAIEELGRVVGVEDAQTPRYMYALATAYLAAGDRAAARRYAKEALRLARQFGQSALAKSIEAALADMHEGK